jgi:hypothetical protein
VKTHTNNFKQQIKLIGKEIDSKITFGDTVLGKNDLNAVTPSFQGAILKSAMKQLVVDSNVEIPIGTVLKYEFGLKVNGSYEYIDFGKYVVKNVEKKEDTNSFEITCFDKMLFTMKEYKQLGIGSFPMTIREYLTNLCLDCGLLFIDTNKEFANYDKIVESDLYANLGYTYRDVLDELSQVTASTICLNKNDSVEVRYITETNDTIDEEYLKDVNVNFGEKFGAVNTIVLSRSADSDSVYYPETLPENPYEIKISDNQIMNGNDRANYLPDIYDKLNGLEFYTNDFVSTGVVYYDLCDRYSVKVGDKTYSCVMFNNEILITQGLEENAYTELPEQTETDYMKADKDDRKIKQAYIIVDKQNQKIDATVETITQQGNSITNLQVADGSIQASIKDVNDNVEQLRQTIEGLENNVTAVGGGNLIKDSLGALNDGSWEGNVATIRDTYALSNSIAGQGIMLNNGIIEQQIQLPNAVHTLSFNYKKRLTTINAKLYIDENVYELDSVETKLFEEQINVTNNSLNIKFECDTDNGCYILDLMLNLGETKETWSQNANETITDTVKIGKGIQVESSKMNTYFRADADGTRVINKTTGEIVREDTDKGTNTNEFISRSTSIVNGVLFARVGNQRWISGV